VFAALRNRGGKPPFRGSECLLAFDFGQGSESFGLLQKRQHWSSKTEYNGDEARRKRGREALILYKAGEALYLAGDVALTAAEEQRCALESDDREGLVETYLETLLPEDWDEMDISRRQNFIRRSHNSPTGTVRREQVSIMEIWCECFENPREMLKTKESSEIVAILKRIGGWTRYTGNKEGRLRVALYGKSTVYVRRGEEVPAVPEKGSGTGSGTAKNLVA
jgi:hypothetical protein